MCTNIFYKCKNTKVNKESAWLVRGLRQVQLAAGVTSKVRKLKQDQSWKKINQGVRKLFQPNVSSPIKITGASL